MEDPFNTFDEDNAPAGEAAAPVLGAIAAVAILGVTALSIGLF